VGSAVRMFRGSAASWRAPSPARDARVLDLIGTGGIGEFCRTPRTRSGRDVSVKVVRAGGPEAKNEQRTSAQPSNFRWAPLRHTRRSRCHTAAAARDAEDTVARSVSYFRLQCRSDLRLPARRCRLIAARHRHPNGQVAEVRYMVLKLVA
jgi:hypothetical protein